MKALGLIVALVALVAVRWEMNQAVRKIESAASANPAPGCLAMLGNTTREEGAFTFIVGSIRNDCDHKIDHVTIAFKLDAVPRPQFDTGAPFLAYSDNLQPGETRQFKTLFHIPKNGVYHFDGMNAY